METDVVEASSTSSVEPVVAERSADPLHDLTDTQRDHWLSTGELPAKKTESSKAEKTDGDSTSSKADPSAAPASGKTEVAGKKAAESATADEQQRREKPTGAEARIKELDSEVKTLRTRLAQLDKPGNTAGGGEKKESVKQPEAKAAPKPEDFTDATEYLDAAIKHGVQEALTNAEKERAEFTKKQTRDAQESEAREKLQKTFEHGKKTHADFDEKALDPQLRIIEGSTFDHWLMDPNMSAELRSELMYHYGTNRDELDTLNAMTPHDATRELNRLEAKLSAGTGKAEGDKLGDSKTAAGEKKSVTKAPPPGSEVGAKGTPTEDPRARAIAAGDVNTYFELENRRDAARKGGR